MERILGGNTQDCIESDAIRARLESLEFYQEETHQ